MTDDLHFISWSRRGAGAGTTAEVDGVHRSVSLPLRINSGDRTVDAPSGPIRLLGPADIEPLSADFGIVRRSPRPDGHPIEPNLLACIEFEHPDVPWLFTPETAAGGRLMPWVMLVAVKMSREREQQPGVLRQSRTTPYRVLRVPGHELPDPRQAWAFAHVQAVAGDAAAGAAAVRDDPGSPTVRSRLLCPTRLEELTRYFAALVPVYEAARRLGVGDLEAHGGELLWNPDADPELPIYDGWFFETGPRGDFEQLARRLSPLTDSQTRDLGIGTRKVAFETRAGLLQRQDDGQDEFYRGVQAVPTAITRVADPGPFAPPTPATDPPPDVDALHFRLKELVDIVAGAAPEQPIVGPPLYGQWHAGTDSIDGVPQNGTLAPVPADSPQTWVEQLNANPFLRIAAGLGARLVQRDQEEYAAEAWRQLADISTANRRTRWATMLSASTSVIQTKLAAAPAAVALRTMAPAAARLRTVDGNRTIFGELQQTTLPAETIGAALTRVSRFAVRIGRFADNPMSTSVIMSTVAGAFADSARELLPSRFTTVPGIDAARVGDLLAYSDLTDIVGQMPGLDVATRLQRITEAPEAMKVVAAKIRDDPALQGPQVQVEVGKKLRDDLLLAHNVDAEGKQAVVDKIAAAKVLVEEGAVAQQAFDEGVAAKKAVHLPHAKFGGMQGAAGVERVLPAGIFAALNDAGNDAAAGGPEAEVPAFDPKKLRIIDAAQGFTLGSLLLGAPGSVVAAADGGRRGFTAAAAEGVKALMLADVGEFSPSVDAQLGALSAADSALVGAEVTALAAGHVPPRDRPLTPDNITKFSFDTAAQMLAELTPTRAYAKLLNYANGFQPGAVLRREGSAAFPQELFPAMAAPLIHTPLATRLADMDPDWLLGGLADLPNNSICLMEINRQFVEAVLVGANHEFGRELLWRGYPTDLRGTCFPRFWDGPDALSITPISTWSGDLGTHSAAEVDKDLAVVVIKGDLLRRYPNTLVSAEKGVVSPDGAPTDFASDGEVAKEWFRGFIGSDVSYSVLGISHERLMQTDGEGGRHCWYISLLEPYDELRFGLDEGDSTPNAPVAGVADRYRVTDTWTWQGLRPGQPVPRPLHLTGDDLHCDGSSAIAGASLLQRPFRLLLRAATYLPKENG